MGEVGGGVAGERNRTFVRIVTQVLKQVLNRQLKQSQLTKRRTVGFLFR